jgi:hypothetical protein
MWNACRHGSRVVGTVPRAQAGRKTCSIGSSFIEYCFETRANCWVRGGSVSYGHIIVLSGRPLLGQWLVIGRNRPSF